MNSIFKRTSVRKYSQNPVSEEMVELLLKAGMAAPSAGNQQPWEFYVVRNPALLDALSQSSPYAGCTKDAQLVIITCFRKEVTYPEYAQIDLSAATENILLEAVELGLGAVWLGVAPLRDRMDAVRRILDIPQDLEAFAMIPVGVPLGNTSQVDRYSEDRIHIIP